MLEQEIAKEEVEFDSRMLQVLDGILAPTYNPIENKRRIDAFQERMSETFDEMARKKNGGYRRSDNALLDKNTLGPVYYKI